MARKVPIKVNCKINNKQFRITGELELHEGEGFCIAEPTFDRNAMPKGFQPEVLSGFLITGYPSASRSIGKARNPFDDLKADFKTTREIDLGTYGQLKTSYYSKDRGTNKERVTFNVSGSVKLPKRITSIAPLSEVWRPGRRPNQFTGQMTFTWILEDGTTVHGSAKSRYNIQSEIQLSTEQMRVITFDLATTATGFKQSEVIRLYDVAEWNNVLPNVMNGNLD